MDWHELRADEIVDLAERDAVVIVPVASTEQHGPHLPTQVDCLLCLEVARRAARRCAPMTPVVVTPVVWTGLAEHHMSFGGTFTLDYATFSSLLRGICHSLVRQGFRRVFLLNGHGGNVAALTVFVNEAAQALGAPIATATYWDLAQKEFGQILEDQATVRHACEAETSMMLALEPALVKMELAKVGPTSAEIGEIAGNDRVQRWRTFAARTRHGVIGDPTRATARKGELLLDAAADAVAKVISKAAFWQAPA